MPSARRLTLALDLQIHMLKKTLRFVGYFLVVLAALLAIALCLTFHDAYSIPKSCPPPCDGPAMLALASWAILVFLEIPLAAVGAALLYFTRVKRRE